MTETMPPPTAASANGNGNGNGSGQLSLGTAAARNLGVLEDVEVGHFEG